MLAAEPRVIFLDEPTRGLDYPGKAALGEILASLEADGRAVVVATHDVEFVAQVADRVVVLADGEVVSEGPTARVVAESPAFAPQVHKVLGARLADRRPGDHAGGRPMTIDCPGLLGGAAAAAVHGWCWRSPRSPGC